MGQDWVVMRITRIDEQHVRWGEIIAHGPEFEMAQTLRSAREEAAKGQNTRFAFFRAGSQPAPTLRNFRPNP